jgi:hypothetical protein
MQSDDVAGVHRPRPRKDLGDLPPARLDRLRRARGERGNRRRVLAPDLEWRFKQIDVGMKNRAGGVYDDSY